MQHLASVACSILCAKLKGIPYKLNYAVTYRCNSRCRLCNIWKRYVESPEQQEEELTLPEVDAIFRQFDLSWLSLTGGEPFLREDLADIALTISRTNRHLQLLSIPTNGSLPDTVTEAVKAILKRVNVANFFVSVSVDGDQKLHNDLRGEGFWEKAKQTYEYLSSIRDKRFRVFLEYTISKYNAGYLKPALDSFGVTDYARVVVTAAHSSFFYRSNDEDLHDGSSLEQVRAYLSLVHPTVEGMVPYVYGTLLEQYLKKKRVPLRCVSGHSSFFLDPSGWLYPCISVGESLGNLRRTALSVILKEKAPLLDRIRRGECPGCWTPCEAYQTILENFPRAMAFVLLR